MSQPSFDDGEAVWVKWGSHWWPGEVWKESRVPDDVKSSLRKPPIFFVKFFQEEAFEFVRSSNNIMKYNCDKKSDFIRKGMDKHKSGIKIMENFPADVVTAEKLTGGNVNILASLETPSKQKPNTSMTASPVTVEKSIAEPSTPVLTKKATGAYNSVTKVQVSSPAPKNDKKISCPMCNFSTDRMNLLMFHIKNHSNVQSPRVSELATPEVKKSSSPKKKSDDSIADDVRKIKESMKKEKEPKARKSREPKAAAATPVTSRASRSKKESAEEKVEVVQSVEKEKEKEKPKPVVSELKKELLADWSDDEDGDVNMEVEKKKFEEPPVPPKPSPAPEKVGESSKSIRNIPKKQRHSQVYIKPEPVKIDPPKEASPAPPEIPKKASPQPEVPKKTSQKAGSKRKHVAEKVEDDSLLIATADLLNKTEVPKVETAQLPSTTFHKTNDIDKRNLPPKERNKRIFRDNNNGTSKEEEPVAITSPIHELMLPHKKKQSSRLATTPPVSVAVRKKRNGSDDKEMEVENSHETKLAKPQSPLRDEKSQEVRAKSPEITKKLLEVANKSMEIVKEPETPEKITDVTLKVSENPAKAQEIPVKSKKAQEIPVKAQKTPEIRSKTPEVRSKTPEIDSKTPETSAKVSETPEQAPETPTKSPEVTNSNSRRGQKRRNSKDSHQASLEDPEACSEPKKLHKSDPETPRTIVACASEAICISSKGHLSVARRDSLKTTQANSVTVTSQVIISEATRQPVVTETTPTSVTSESVATPKPQISSTIKIPKNALKFPAEKLVEMKKQGLVTVGLDKKNKLTEKGKQIFKESQAAAAPEPEQIKPPEVVEAPETAQNDVEMAEPEQIEEAKVEETVEEVQEAPEVEAEVEESTNNNDETPSKDPPEDDAVPEPVENGKEAEGDSGGLIALQAETFGGPPNCFYLCRQIEDHYEPVDNQILVLNAQNALVPYEGDIVTEETLRQTEIAAENLAGYPQHSPNSNIIINTPNGQKIELNHFMILALQEQADENGIASIELSGEQLELNINGILEAISQQNESAEGEGSIPGAMLLDGDNADLKLILDSDMHVEIHHSATQVSETLTKPIMSTTVAPEIPAKATISETSSKNLNLEDSLASIGVTTQTTRSNVPKSLELPITVTNPTIADTVNHRKLANAPAILGDIIDVAGAVVPDTFIVQSDNGPED